MEADGVLAMVRVGGRMTIASLVAAAQWLGVPIVARTKETEG